MVIPDALTIKSLKPGRPFCNLGKLAHEVGWKHYELIKRLEAARKCVAARPACPPRQPPRRASPPTLPAPPTFPRRVSSKAFYTVKRAAMVKVAKAKAAAPA